MSALIYTIGHSTHTIERFVELLKQHSIETVVDVRSAPASRFVPHFSKRAVEAQLPRHGLSYVYKGDAVGGLPADISLRHEDGRTNYDRVAQTERFKNGIDWLVDRATSSKVVLMCAEENPAKCHRHLLIARVLNARGVNVQHIRGENRLESYSETESQLNAGNSPSAQVDLFQSEE
jgi:uncharacterized protein (DUF488 family)